MEDNAFRPLHDEPEAGFVSLDEQLSKYSRADVRPS
jgi:hypothetical protein